VAAERWGVGADAAFAMADPEAAHR
jgi:hypothetical protein